MEFITNAASSLTILHIVMGAIFAVAMIIALSARATKWVIIIGVVAVIYFIAASWLGVPADNPAAVINAAADAINAIPLP